MAVVTYIEAIERKHPTENATYSFRPLSGDELDQCSAEMLRELAGRYDEDVVGTMKSLKDIEDSDKEKQPEERTLTPPVDTEAEPEEENPLRGYSRKLLVEFGLIAWRGSGPKGQIDYDQIPCDAKNKLALDRETREWAAKEIIALSVVPEGKSGGSADASASGDRPPASPGAQSAMRSESSVPA